MKKNTLFLALSTSFLIQNAVNAETLVPGCRVSTADICARQEIFKNLGNYYSNVKSQALVMNPDQIEIKTVGFLDYLFNTKPDFKTRMLYTSEIKDYQNKVKGYARVLQQCVLLDNGIKYTKCTMNTENVCQDSSMLSLKNEYGLDILKVKGTDKCVTCND